MKSILCMLLLVSVSSLLSAAQPGETMPKLTPLLPGAKLPETVGKVVLVDFWASWCAPCKASFPSLNKLHATYASKGLVVIGVGVDDDAAKYQAFASKMKASFPLVHDASHKAVGTFSPPTMPTSYLIDRKGVIRHVHSGFKGAKTEAEYVAEIEVLLAESR